MLLNVSCIYSSFLFNVTCLRSRARVYQASQRAILVLSAENSWNVLLLSNLSINASYPIS